MSRIEDRALEYDPDSSNPYEKIQKIKRRQEKHKEMQQKKVKKQTHSVVEIDKVSTQKDVSKEFSKQYKPNLKSKFKWRKDEEHGYSIAPKEKKSIPSLKPVHTKSTDRILNFLGYKIDINDKVDEFKEKYQKFYIESRSHNFLLSKFSELKAGAFQFILGALGVSTDEIKALQRESLKVAVEENITLFEQNEYNYELLYVFQAAKQDKKRLVVLDEVRKQLLIQMERLGKEDYYTEEKKIEIKKDSVKKVMQELLQERQTLEYTRDFV